MKVAIVPARGGSKRIPRKNVRVFCGRPMIAWSLEAARKSGCFDRIIVSTDDEEIADVARDWGAEVPFMRPSDLADDNTGTVPVIKHALQWIEEREHKVAYACCLYATAPFLRSEDINGAFERIKNGEEDYVFSATTYTFPIQRALRCRNDGRIEMFYPEHLLTRSQDLEEAFHDAGQFYWGKGEAWREGRPIMTPSSGIFLLPRHRVQDIDTEEDWIRAELLFRALKDMEH